MCKSLDVAVALLDKSIKRAEETGNERYLMDFVKVHKLLYLGQCYILSQHNMDLFEEKVTTHNCGPYIDGLDLLPALCGFSEIRSVPNELRSRVVPMSLSYMRDNTLNIILERYGLLDTFEVVAEAKSTSAYKSHESQCDNHPIILRSEMKLTGIEIFGSQT